MIHAGSLPTTLTFDYYAGPWGEGYTLASDLVLAGQTWRRIEHAGPEVHRERDWHVLPPFEGVTLGALGFNATEASVGINLPFTETTGQLDHVTVEYRVAGTLAWREALPLWPTRPTTGQAAAYGSICRLRRGTTYDVRVRAVTVAGGETTLSGTATTRAIEIPDLSTRDADRYVDPVNGDDARDGQTELTAWRTYAKLMATYPMGGTPEARTHLKIVTHGTPVYLTAAGQHVNRGTMTLFADGPATIEPGAVTAPCCTVVSDPWVTVAPWVQVSGHPGVWEWTGCPIADPTQGSYAAARDGRPLRLAHWKRSTGLLSTADGWAQTVTTNQTYRFGFWSDGAGTVRCRLPGDLDPNTRWLWFGDGTGLELRNSDHRVSGLRVHTFAAGIYVSAGHGAIIDRNTIQNCLFPVRAQGNVADVLIEKNTIQDSNLWDDAPSAPHVVPWDGIKSAIVLADGTRYGSKVLGNSETSAIAISSGGRRCIVRDNTIEDGFNGVQVIGTQSNSGVRTWGDNCDVHGNTIRRMSDDALEPEKTVVNLRAWNNDITACLTLISIGPVHYGPLYLFDNTAYRIGPAGVGRLVDGTVEVAGKAIKFSAGSSPQARLWFVGNAVDTEPGVMFAGDSAGGHTSHEAFTLVDNVIVCGSYLIDAQVIGDLVEHHNLLATSDPSRGIRLQTAHQGSRFDYENTGPGTTFADYRAASGQGTGTNLDAAGVQREVNDPAWVDMVRAVWSNRDVGDLRTLAPGCIARGAGCYVPNLRFAASPDLGALAVGAHP